MGKAIVVPIDNPEKVVKASNCLMNDGATSIETYVTEKGVEQTNYVELTVNVEYTCPCDGYFQLNATATSNRYVYGYVNNVLLVAATTSVSANSLGYTINAIFVRKGSKLKFQRDGSNAGTARFYALSPLS